MFVADVLFAPWAVFLVGAVAGAACTVRLMVFPTVLGAGKRLFQETGAAAGA